MLHDIGRRGVSWLQTLRLGISLYKSSIDCDIIFIEIKELVVNNARWLDLFPRLIPILISDHLKIFKLRVFANGFGAGIWLHSLPLLPREFLISKISGIHVLLNIEFPSMVKPLKLSEYIQGCSYSLIDHVCFDRNLELNNYLKINSIQNRFMSIPISDVMMIKKMNIDHYYCSKDLLSSSNEFVRSLTIIFSSPDLSFINLVDFSIKSSDQIENSLISLINATINKSRFNSRKSTTVLLPPKVDDIQVLCLIESSLNAFK